MPIVENQMTKEIRRTKHEWSSKLQYRQGLPGFGFRLSFVILVSTFMLLYPPLRELI